MSNSLQPEPLKRLPIQSTLLSMEEFEVALANDVSIQQTQASINERSKELAEVHELLKLARGARLKKESLIRRISGLTDVLKKRRQAVCRKLISEKIKEARKDLGLTTKDVS
jgi:hypothetical protein